MSIINYTIIIIKWKREHQVENSFEPLKSGSNSLPSFFVGNTPPVKHKNVHFTNVINANELIH